MDVAGFIPAIAGAAVAAAGVTINLYERWRRRKADTVDAPVYNHSGTPATGLTSPIVELNSCLKLGNLARRTNILIAEDAGRTLVDPVVVFDVDHSKSQGESRENKYRGYGIVSSKP